MMGKEYSFCLALSGITVRFITPTPISLPDNFQPFQVDEPARADEEYRVELLTAPLDPGVPRIHQEGAADIYRTDRGWLHLYPTLGDDAGCQVGCLCCPDGRHTLYYPASRWEEYARIWRCGHLIGAEKFLLRHDAFLLHSSCVRINNQTVLFSGPSGAGKSTQAELWKQHLGADILNGDRAIIRRTETGFTAAGSIWAGSSGIYRREQAPLAGIFLLQQAEENRVERLGFEAFVPLFSQTILNSWDPEFMAAISGLYADFLARVPVYRLCCRPDRDAVELAYTTLFGKESVQ